MIMWNISSVIIFQLSKAIQTVLSKVPSFFRVANRPAMSICKFSCAIYNFNENIDIKFSAHDA